MANIVEDELFTLVSKALIGAPSAWQTPKQIGQAIGVTVVDAIEILALLERSHLVDFWASHDPPVVTLSPLGASRLGVRLVETRRAEIFRWSRESVTARSRKAPSRAQVKATEEHERRLEAASLDPHDHVAEVDQVLDEQGRRDRRRRRARRELPRPTLLLIGDPLIPWHEIELPGPDCPTCGGLELGRSTYCLRCSRWGFEIVRHARKRPPSDTSSDEADSGAPVSDTAPAAPATEKPDHSGGQRWGSLAEADRRGSGTRSIND